MSNYQNLEEIFQKNFAAVKGGFGKNSRSQGFNHFLNKGLPSKLQESWKYTSLKKLSDQDLVPAMTAQFSYQALEAMRSLSSAEFHQIFVLNGQVFMKASDRKSFKGKLQISLGSSAVSQNLKKDRRLTGLLRQDSLEGLNSAFAKTISLKALASTSLQKPVHVLFYSEQSEALYPRMQIQVSQGAHLSLIESYFSSGKKHFTNAMTEISVDNSAKLKYLRLQSENKNSIHFGCTRIYLKKDSHLESLAYATGGEISRHNLDIHCLQENATASVNGLTMGGGEQHFDNSTRIDHTVGHCTTSQLYKSLLAGKSKAVFRGQVEIRPHAQKASSEQLNKNLLLSKEAEADSVPQLNIYADDVKATHGSTVGQVSEEEIFYMLSRAISRDKALELLSLGFVKDLVDRVSDKDIRTWLEKNLEKSYRELQ